MNKNELKPCPLCGNGANLRERLVKHDCPDDDGLYLYSIACRTQLCAKTGEYGLAVDAIKSWNNRPTPNAALDDALNCTIEHLEGEHEGKVVVDYDVFNTLYEKASLQSGGWQEINNSNLGQFLDEIEFNNLCCGCANQDYDLKKPFKALIEPPATEEEG